MLARVRMNVLPAFLLLGCLGEVQHRSLPNPNTIGAPAAPQDWCTASGDYVGPFSGADLDGEGLRRVKIRVVVDLLDAHDTDRSGTLDNSERASVLDAYSKRCAAQHADA